MAGFPTRSASTSTGRFPSRARRGRCSRCSTMAAAENPKWEGGQCSGTMYSGDHDHYDFLNEAFAHFSYVNALQRDLCPSSTKFEAEIIAMTLDLLGAGSINETTPAGLVTSGGPASIAHAVLAYREHHPTPGRPNMIKPETAHAAFAKAGHLFGVEMRVAPVDPVTTQVDLEWVKDPHRREHRRAHRLGLQLRLRHDRPDRRARPARPRARGRPARRRLPRAASSCPSDASWATTIEPFDFSVPGVTSISADTHKYGYALKGTSVLCFADKALRNGQYFYLTDWSGGRYCSPGMDGSRSAGCSPRPGRRWSTSGARATAATRRRSSRPGRDARRRARAPVAADARQAQLSLRLHLRRVRRVPGERLLAHRGAGGSTVSSTPTRCTWR